MKRTKAGKPIPKQTSGICTAKESACICLASKRYSWSTGANGAAAAMTNVLTSASPRPLLREAGVERHPAVDEDRRADDVVGLVGGDPGHRASDVVDLPPAAVRDLRLDRCLALRIGEDVRVDRRSDRSGSDGHDADPVRGQFPCDRLREQFLAALR